MALSLEILKLKFHWKQDFDDGPLTFFKDSFKTTTAGSVQGKRVAGRGPPVQTCHQSQRKLTLSHAWFTLLIFLCLRLLSFSTLRALPLSLWKRPSLRLSIGWSVHLNIRPSGLTARKASDIHALAASALKDWQKCRLAQKEGGIAAIDTLVNWEGTGAGRSGSR